MRILKPVEKLYHYAVSTKSYLFDLGILKSVSVKVPVVSVGNLSFGGVGKTPCVILLAKEFSLEHKINIITKSYKAGLKEPKVVDLEIDKPFLLFGDEACLIQSKLPNCQVWSGPDKSSTAVASLINRPGLIILDDGFSHRKLKRNFDLVLIDSTRGFDDYFRESVKSLKRAHAVLITKVNLSESSIIYDLQSKLISAAPNLKNNIFLSGVVTELKLKKQSPLFVFCGLGHPESFIKDLSLQGYKVVQQKFYPDHYAYSKTEQKNIFDHFLLLKQKYTDIELVTTEKDFIKISEAALKNILKVPEHRMEIISDKKGTLFEKIRQSL